MRVREGERVRKRLKLLCLLAILLLPARPVRAHSGGLYPVLLDREVGPYRVDLWIDPDLGGGEVQIRVRTGAGDPLPRPEALRVELTLTPEGPEGSVLAVTARWDGEGFVARVPFGVPGPWQGRVRIAGPEGGGEATFPVQVLPPTRSEPRPWIWGLLLLLGAAAGLLLGRRGRGEGALY